MIKKIVIVTGGIVGAYLLVASTLTIVGVCPKYRDFMPGPRHSSEEIVSVTEYWLLLCPFVKIVS